MKPKLQIFVACPFGEKKKIRLGGEWERLKEQGVAVKSRGASLRHTILGSLEHGEAFVP